MHPALAPQLPHAGVDERVAGPSLAPRQETFVRAAPADRAPVARLVLGACVAGEVQEHVREEVPPGELPAKLRVIDAVFQFARRQASEVQIGGEARGARLGDQVALGAVAAGVVGRECPHRGTRVMLASRLRFLDLLA